MPQIKYSIVEITWLDTKAINDSCTAEEIGTLCTIKSVGYLVGESDFVVPDNGLKVATYSIAQEVHDDGQFRDVTTIPVINVISKSVIQI